jgi:hypothetical protein
MLQEFNVACSYFLDLYRQYSACLQLESYRSYRGIYSLYVLAPMRGRGQKTSNERSRLTEAVVICSRIYRTTLLLHWPLGSSAIKGNIAFCHLLTRPEFFSPIIGWIDYNNFDEKAVLAFTCHPYSNIGEPRQRVLYHVDIFSYL